MKKIVHCCSQCRGDGGLAVVARIESKAAHCLKTLLLLTWLSAELYCRVVVAAKNGGDEDMVATWRSGRGYFLTLLLFTADRGEVGVSKKKTPADHCVEAVRD
ncbi:hypothetical protein NC651_018147 [Populus alba x Populus x berolinensis]|nr:hypothetical protein NC651_018147 [Populus alba x Populus x berolinensis]